MQWGFENFTSKTLARQGEEVTYTKVKLSTDTNQLLLTAKADVVALLPKDLDVKELDLSRMIPEEVKAPVNAGDPIGTATYRYNGTDYGTVELVALNDISRSTVLFLRGQAEHLLPEHGVQNPAARRRSLLHPAHLHRPCLWRCPPPQTAPFLPLAL